MCNFATYGNALQERQSITPYAPVKSVLPAHPGWDGGIYASHWVGATQ